MATWRISSMVKWRLNSVWVMGLLSGCYATSPENGPADAARITAEPSKCMTPQEADRLADQVLELINLERAMADLPPAVVNPVLSKMASDYACRMIEEGFFGHEDPINGHGPGDRAVTYKYAFYAVGENLAAGPESSAAVMKAWMGSPSHRAIILDERWKEVGIAVRGGGEYATYWVQEFGDPAAFARSTDPDD